METGMGMMVYNADVGGTVALTAQVLKGAAGSVSAPADLKWTSSNPEVATVDAGTVTGVSPGYADISIAGTLEDGSRASAFCKVQVHAVNAQRLVIRGPDATTPTP
jgi:uncharacterized protein YjdB